jgi:DNA-binding response OmpR family regulator
LVLLDLRLPLVPGLEVLKWMRSQARLSCLPVVVLTSSRQDTDMRNAYGFGANSFLVKPCDANDLVTMVKAAGEYWLKFNEAPTPESIVAS